MILQNQTNKRKLVEETVAELTSQGHPFSKSETLVFPEIQKSPESLFLRRRLRNPQNFYLLNHQRLREL